MKVTPVSIKVRRWFVAGVAAVMAIAWTVSSLVTPGSAQGNEVYTASEYKPPFSLSTEKNYRVIIKDKNGRSINTAPRTYGGRVTGPGGSFIGACIDPGKTVRPPAESPSYTPGNLIDFPRSSYQGQQQASAQMTERARKWAAVWGDDIVSGRWDDIRQKTGVQKLPEKIFGLKINKANKDINNVAPGLAAYLGSWAFDGKVSLDLSEVKYKVVPGINLRSDDAGEQVRAIAKRMWEIADSYVLPTTVVGAAGGSAGTNVSSAGFDKNGKYVVEYELNGPASVSGQEATLNVAGMPRGGKLVDKATGAEVSTGSKVTLPAKLTLTLPKSAAKYYPFVRITAKAAQGAVEVGSTYKIPIAIDQPAGQQATVTVKGLPEGAKLITANGREFVNGSSVTIPAKLFAVVPSGKPAHLAVSLGVAGASKAKVQVIQESQKTNADGSVDMIVNITGESDTNTANISVTAPQGVSVTNVSTGTPVRNGESTVNLPTKIKVHVPQGTPAGAVKIEAKTKSFTEGTKGKILRPSNQTSQWLVILNGTPASSATAHAGIVVAWEQPTVPPKQPKEGSFVIGKKFAEGSSVDASNVGNHQFKFDVSCSDNTSYQISVTGAGTGESRQHEEGVTCQVTENEEAAQIQGHNFEDYHFMLGNRGGVTLKGSKTATVTIKAGTKSINFSACNDYSQDKGSFKIVKSFKADSSFKGDDSKAFDFDVTCGGKSIAGVKLNKASNWQWSSDAMPVGTKCVVKEKISTAGVKGHSFAGVKLTATSGVVTENEATFNVGKGTNSVTVTAENKYAKPTLQTDASIKGDNKLVKGKATQLQDKVTFTGLQKGKTYTVGGYFIDKSSGEAVTEFYTRTFTTADLEGAVTEGDLVSGYLVLTDAKWSVTPSSNRSQAFVAFEYLWAGEVPTPNVPSDPGTDKVTPKPDVEHENPDDPNQTVSSEEKGSFTIEKKLAGGAASKVAKDTDFPFTVNCGAERTEMVKVGEKFVSEELPVGTKCTVKENDVPLHFESATFEKVAFTLNGQPVDGDTASFAIKAGDSPAVAVVATNTYTPPSVTTDAEPEVPAREGESVRVVDTVSYTNLVAGRQYRVEGQLHYQSVEGGSVVDGGVVPGVTPGDGFSVGSKPDSVATSFVVPGREGELVSGSVELVFVVPASAVASEPMVVFEDVFYRDRRVVGHHDIRDEAQTVPVAERVEFAIKKLLAGDGASKANGTYSFVARCAKPGVTGEPQNVSVTVTDGASAVSKDRVRAFVGDVCVVEETAPVFGSSLTSSVNFADGGVAGVTGGESLTVKVSEDNKDQLQEFVFEATNTVSVDRARFSVTKSDVGVDGNVAVPGEYRFVYDCEGATGELVVSEGQTKQGPALPVGTTCRVGEVGAGVAGAVLDTSWRINGAGVQPNADGEVVFSLNAKDQVVAVSAVNNYRQKTGSFQLAKKVSTSSTTRDLDGRNYKFNYRCVDEAGKVVAESKTPIDVAANGTSVSVNSIPVGAQCTVEEVVSALPAAPDADMQLSWTIDGSPVDAKQPSFTIADEDHVVGVVATNSYVDKKPGFVVKKAVSGDAKHAPKTYTFDYECGDVSGEFQISETTGFQSVDDPKLKDLGVGTECTITERMPQVDDNTEWTGVSYARSGNESGTWKTDIANHAVTFSVPAGDTAVVVKATNTVNQKRGKINIAKVVEDNGVTGISESFTFDLSCSFDGEQLALESSTRTIRPGENATWENLPVGAQCHVTELDAGTPEHSSHDLAWNVDGKTSTGNNVAVVVNAEETGVNVTATNTYGKNPGSFTIQKRSAKVTPEGAKGEVPKQFLFEYRCGKATEWTALEPITVGGKERVDGLVPDEMCQLREKPDGNPSRIVNWIIDGKPVVEPGDAVTITPEADQNVAVVVDNEYPTEPKIKTTLTDAADNHDVSANGDVVLKDVVKYYNLDTTKTYEVSGTLKAWNDNGEIIDTGIVNKPITFTPEKTDGEVIVEFTIPGGKLKDFAKVVAFEYLKIDGKLIAKHEDPEDPNQVVKAKPSLATTLTGKDGETKTYDRPTDPDAVVELVDKVDYWNLRVGKTYRIEGKLHGDNGLTGVTAYSEPFTVKAPADDPDAEFVSGSHKIVFKVKASVLQQNSKLVAFEYLWDEDKLQPGNEYPTPKEEGDEPDAKHEDPDDPAQTIKRNPSIATSAKLDSVDGKKATRIELQKGKNQQVSITDTLSWYDLAPGNYVAVATLVDKDGTAIDNKSHGKQSFTVTEGQTHGHVDVAMKASLNDALNEKVVVFERVYKAADVENGLEEATPVATHEDVKDTNQSIPVGPTPPLSSGVGVLVSKVIGQGEGYVSLPASTLFGFELSCVGVDRVERFALRAGEVHSSSLVSADIAGSRCKLREVGAVESAWSESDGWQLLDLGSEAVWSEVSWSDTCEASDSSSSVSDSVCGFTVPESSGSEVELELMAKNYFKPVVPPAAPREPSLGTSAEDMRMNNPVKGVDRSVRWGSDAAIEDTVSFKNFQVGKSYTIRGQVMDKDSGARVSAVTVTNKNSCGVEASGDVQQLKCVDEGDGVVSLSFVLNGEADAYVDGVARLQFRIGAEAVKKDARFVVFEEAFVDKDGVVESVVKHHDINDADQTITTDGCPPVPPNNPPTPDIPGIPTLPPDNPEQPGGDDSCPRVSTTLTTAGKAPLVRGRDNGVVDTIYYVDLAPETTYTMLGRLHKAGDASASGVLTDVKPGEKCVADGKPVKCLPGDPGFVKVEFTTGAANNERGLVDGEVEMGFVVGKSALGATDKVVAFESLLDAQGRLVAWHHDIDSEPQSELVRVPEPPAPPAPPSDSGVPPTPVAPPASPPSLVNTVLAKTGVGAFTLLMLGLMGLLGGGVLVWASPQRRRQ